jgi:hypothetical protein
MDDPSRNCCSCKPQFSTRNFAAIRPLVYLADRMRDTVDYTDRFIAQCRENGARYRNDLNIYPNVSHESLIISRRAERFFVRGRFRSSFRVSHFRTLEAPAVDRCRMIERFAPRSRSAIDRWFHFKPSYGNFSRTPRTRPDPRAFLNGEQQDPARDTSRREPVFYRPDRFTRYWDIDSTRSTSRAISRRTDRTIWGTAELDRKTEFGESRNK